MFWLILVIIVVVVVVGFFIVRAINGGSARKPLPIPKKIDLLKELISKYQDYLGKEYKQQLEEWKTKHTPGSATLVWDPDTEKYFQDCYDDLLKYIQLNANLCEKLRNNEQQLFEQMYDWSIYLEKLMEIISSHANIERDIDNWIYAGVDTPRDEVADAERRGLMQETHERIMARAKAQGVLTKELIISVL